MQTYLSKVCHLTIIRESTQHTHGGHTHTKHTICIECIVIAIWTTLGLLLLCLNLALLLLLCCKRGNGIRAQLRVHNAIRWCADGQRGCRVEGTTGKTACAVGGWSRRSIERLSDRCLWTIAIVGKSITGVV